MKKTLILIFSAIALALPSLMLYFSLNSSAHLLQLEHEKQLETRMQNDLQAQSQLSGIVLEAFQHFSFFMAETDQLYKATSWNNFAQDAEKVFDAFIAGTAESFPLPFSASVAFNSPSGNKQLSYENSKRVEHNILAKLTRSMRQFNDPAFFENHEVAPIKQLAELLAELPGFFFDLNFLKGAGDSSETNRLVFRQPDSTQLLLTIRSGRDFLLNALFDLKAAGIRFSARRKTGHWTNKDSGLLYFGGGARIKPVHSAWFNDREHLVGKIVNLAGKEGIKQTRLIIDGNLVLLTPYDPKTPWQCAIVAPVPPRAAQTGMKLLLGFFAIASLSIWKLLVDSTVFERKFVLSLRNFVIIVFVLVTLLPFTSGVYLTNEFVLANFKVQKNLVAENLSADLQDLDLTTFSQFRDTINRAKGLNSIENIASFTGLPQDTDIRSLAKGLLDRLWQIKGRPLVSEVWIISGLEELQEVEFKTNEQEYVYSQHHDVLTNEIFVPRFRQVLLAARKPGAIDVQETEKIKFDEVKGEVLDSILLNMFGETTYFGLQKNLGTIIRLESFFESNSLISIPVTKNGKMEYIISYIFASSELRRHFPGHKRNIEPGKPVIFTLFGNDKYLNAQPISLQQVSVKLPELTALAKQAFLSTSRLVAHDVTASGSPVYEAFPAKYSDYIICGQSNTRSLESISSELTTTAVKYFAIMALTGLLTALMTAMYFTIPIKQLTEATRKIINEDYSVRLPETHPDEFALSAAAFNKMASGLAEGQLLRHFVSESVRDMASEEALLNDGRAKTAYATVLFSSIKNFAELQIQLEPEKIFALMQAHLSAAVEMASQLGGEIDKMIEDKVMIVFPHHGPDGKKAAVAALRAAAHIRDSMLQTYDHQTAIGINSGEVVSGTMGAANVRLAKTVVGDTVNLAARLASVAAGLADGGIVAAGTTVLLAGDKFSFEKMAISSVKGKTHAVEAFLANDGWQKASR